MGGHFAAAGVLLDREAGAARAGSSIRGRVGGGRPGTQGIRTTAKGRAALADALERGEWTTHRERPSFLTWIALSWQARSGVFRRQIERRRKFLEKELAREKATLRSIEKEVGHRFHEAAWMVGLIIEQFRGELRWLGKLERELPRRAAAKSTFR